LDKGLIEAVGRLDAPGRPMLYGTTDKFLRVFGLNSLADLPETEAMDTATAAKEAASEGSQESAQTGNNEADPAADSAADPTATTPTAPQTADQKAADPDTKEGNS
jgi:segregation and condensation protein B